MKRLNSKINNEELFIMFYFLRIILAFVVMAAIFAPWKSLALVLFTLTIILGYIDYVRFRLTGKYTQTGSILSSLADKLLIILSSTALYMKGELPLWIAGVFVSKDILLIIGGFYTLTKNEFTVFKPSTLGKLALFFQIIAMIAIIFDKPDNILLFSAVGLTVISLAYTYFRPELKILKKHEQLQEFAFKKIIKPADYLTIANIILGLLCIIFAILGKPSLANIALISAVVFDFLDGRIARLTKTQNEFGKQLDSLADTISFGVAPTVIAFTLIQSNLAIIAFSIFLICGVMRLAKFNIMELKGSYIGMPITFNGIIIPIIYFIGVSYRFYPYIYLVLAILMVAPVQLTKKR